MRVIVAGEDKAVAAGQTIADSIIGGGGDHEVFTYGGDVRDATAIAAALSGAGALVLVAPRQHGEGWPAELDVLDRATRGTYVALNTALSAGIRRIVLVSTLTLFERYPARWLVNESWRPLPDVRRPDLLAAYLAEESAKELSRVEPIQVVCLRLGTVDASERDAALHDALDSQLVRQERLSTGRIDHGWWVRHIGQRPAAGEDESAEGVPSRPIQNVVVFGAGGPLAASAQPLLTEAYRVRLTDVRALEEIVAEGKPQSPGAPLPTVPRPPHDTMRVDVTNFDQVLRACEGMDAIINCTVVRPHPVLAFHVNALGAYNVMKAAVAQRIRRVVHTGPLQVLTDQPAGYAWDFGVPDEAPARPGNWIYLHSKYLGQEIVRLFAEQYRLEVPALLFCNFVNPAHAQRRGGIGPFTVSWDDAGHAVRAALSAPDLPSPFEPIHVLADLPHGKYSNTRAKRLLSWQPRDTLEALYTREEER